MKNQPIRFFQCSSSVCRVSALSTNAGLAEALWNAEFYRLGADYMDRFPQLIQAVTAEEVNALDVVSHRECLMTQSAYTGLLKRLKS